jgi:hypothetical protein
MATFQQYLSVAEGCCHISILTSYSLTRQVFQYLFPYNSTCILGVLICLSSPVYLRLSIFAWPFGVSMSLYVWGTQGTSILTVLSPRVDESHSFPSEFAAVGICGQYGHVLCIKMCTTSGRLPSFIIHECLFITGWLARMLVRSWSCCMCLPGSDCVSVSLVFIIYCWDYLRRASDRMYAMLLDGCWLVLKAVYLVLSQSDDAFANNN